MTRDDMKIIVAYYLWGASPKGVREDTNIQVAGGEIQDFLLFIAEFLDNTIEEGRFDGERYH